MNKEDFNGMQEKKFMRAKELAQYLNIGLSTVWDWNKKNRIKSYKIGARITVFNVQEVEQSLFSEVA